MRLSRFETLLGFCLLACFAALVGRLIADDNDGDPNTGATFTFANGKNSVIPCKFILNSILIPIPTPDKKFAYLLFDTGASAPMITAEFAQKMRIRSGGEIPAEGIGQQLSTGGVSSGIDFSLSGITFHHARWVICRARRSTPRLGYRSWACWVSIC